jgi:hypothetical protein
VQCPSRSPAIVGVTIGGLATVIAFGYRFSWVYATIGVLTKDPETAEVARSTLPFFILISPARRSYPSPPCSAVQPFAGHQPVS